MADELQDTTLFCHCGSAHGKASCTLPLSIAVRRAMAGPNVRGGGANGANKLFSSILRQLAATRETMPIVFLIV